MRLEPGKVISDRYEIKEQIGSGGMAIVYRALDLKLDRSITLKVMREDLEEGFIERFYKEAQSVAGLSHANIVKVYDYGEDDGVHYIVMEYVDGTTLKDLIIKKAPFDEESTLGVAVQIVRGLLHAHKNDVIHRDIKPQNILVTHDGSVKIADFGIARVAKVTTLTSNANSMGSVHYFSPEQARGGFVDHKSDIYALGITMFEMATGRLPYDGEAAVAVALKHINDPFPHPQEINPDITDHLCHIICKATEKSSSKRYAAIEDMYRDMKRTINNVDFLEPLSFEDSPTVEISPEDLENIRQHRRDYQEQHRHHDRETREIRDGRDDRDGRDVRDARDGRDDKSSKHAYNANNEDFNKDFNEDFDEGFYEDEKTDRRVVIAAFSTAAILVALITAASMIIYFNLRDRTVSPPHLIGLSYDEAVELVESTGLVLAMVEERFDEEHEAGAVIEQSVTPEDTLRRGEPVHVVLSLGSAYIPIPPLIHEDLDDALAWLDYLRLDAEIIEYPDPTTIANVVVRVEPDVGTLVTSEQMITLYVSLGPDNSPFDMISLLGLDEVEAVEIVQDQLGLAIGSIARQPNVMYAEGTVSGQSISPNESVLPGQIINLTVSTGTVMPSPTPTPNPTPTPEPTPEPTPTPEPSPGATPGPTASPQPEPTPAPVSTPGAGPPAQVVSSNLTISLWPVPDGTESVHMRVYARSEAGTMQNIANYRVPVGEFPVNLPISGTGLVDYRIYSVEDNGSPQIRASGEIDLSIIQ